MPSTMVYPHLSFPDQPDLRMNTKVFIFIIVSHSRYKLLPARNEPSDLEAFIAQFLCSYAANRVQ
jgi:hypothetical protein